jgi:hypothetical protein
MNRKIPVVSLITLLALVSCSFAIRGHRAQVPTASVTVISESDRDPIQVTRLYLGDQELTSGVDFPIDPDWVKNLKFEVKNVGSRNIKMVWLILYLKGPDGNMKLNFILGKNYWDNKSLMSYTDDITLHPGETAMVGYNPVTWDGFKKALANQNIVLGTEGYILLQIAVFDDLTNGWFYGRPFHRDGDKWVEVFTKAPGRKDLL